MTNPRVPLKRSYVHIGKIHAIRNVYYICVYYIRICVYYICVYYICMRYETFITGNPAKCECPFNDSGPPGPGPGAMTA